MVASSSHISPIITLNEDEEFCLLSTINAVLKRTTRLDLINIGVTQVPNFIKNTFFNIGIILCHIRIEQLMTDVEALFHHHWLLRYELENVAAVAAGTHFSGYTNLKWASMAKPK